MQRVETREEQRKRREKRAKTIRENDGINRNESHIAENEEDCTARLWDDSAAAQDEDEHTFTSLQCPPPDAFPRPSFSPLLFLLPPRLLYSILLLSFSLNHSSPRPCTIYHHINTFLSPSLSLLTFPSLILFPSFFSAPLTPPPPPYCYHPFASIPFLYRVPPSHACLPSFLIETATLVCALCSYKE